MTNDFEIGDKVKIIHRCTNSMETIEIYGVIVKNGHPTDVRIDTENQKGLRVKKEHCFKV